jgi:molybdopterin molybdotransferase
VKVSKSPKVGIVVTGNEFVKTHEELKIGKVFESNGLMLQSVLEDQKISSDYILCEDDIDKLTKVVKEAANKKDIIIITGGVSVGDYDFTRAVLEKLDFRIIFHRVSQKPGMPILFARKGNKTVFGLPGNPRSVLVCFYEYIYPLYKQWEIHNHS